MEGRKPFTYKDIFKITMMYRTYGLQKVKI